MAIQLFEKAETTLGVISSSLFLVGIIGYSILSDNIENDEEVSRDMVLLTAGSFVAAGIFGLSMAGARSIKEHNKDEVRATFASKEQSSSYMENLPAIRSLPDDFRLNEEDMKRLFPAPVGPALSAP